MILAFLGTCLVLGFLLIPVWMAFNAGNAVKQGKAITELRGRIAATGLGNMADEDLAPLRPQNPGQRRLWIKHYGTDELGGLGEPQMDAKIARLRARDGI